MHEIRCHELQQETNELRTGQLYIIVGWKDAPLLCYELAVVKRPKRGVKYLLLSGTLGHRTPSDDN